MTVRKLSLTVLASVVLLAGTDAVTGSAQAQDTAAVAINTKDDSSVFKLAFSIRRVMNGVVDESNAAVAFASCEACQTVALSYQVVLILSDPEIVSPENLALALNYECTLCETLASAYQYVLTTGGAVHLSAEANHAIAELRQRLQELRNSDATMEEIAAEADAIAQELYAVIGTGLVDGPRPVDEGEAGTSGSEAPAAGESSSPSEQPDGSAPSSEESPAPGHEQTVAPEEEGSPTSEPGDEESATPAPEPSES